MKFAYSFSNLMGTVYRRGNLLFTPDGNTLLSPVGNRVSVFDLKNNKSQTLPIESRFNITCVALAPNGNLLILVNEEGEAYLCSLLNKAVIHKYHFHAPVHDIKFSPDGSKFAVTKGSKVLVFHAPGKNKVYNPFILYRTFYGAYSDNLCLDWTSDSRAFCVGSSDMNTRVYGAQRFENLIIYSLGGHNDSIVAAFFEKNSLDLYTLSQNGQLCVWECDTDLDGLKPTAPGGSQETAVAAAAVADVTDEGEGVETDQPKGQDVTAADEAKAGSSGSQKILYKRLAKHNYKEARGEGAGFAKVTSAAYNKDTRILVTAFGDGTFVLHEMPDFIIIHSLSISEQAVTAAAFNSSGDWLALGCAGLGQLLVWEWQSETYVLKQQGHFDCMSSLAYSPDGMHLATGGDDGKVKLWNTLSGFCYVTFTEHTAAITDVTFSQSGRVVLSSSRDGTVRAFDLTRYRNFRTFTSPRPVQFSCLTIDPSGEIVCAGGHDAFDVFVWSMQTGRLLEILAGHEGPVSSVAFSPTQALLASGSWDKTVRLWDVFENKGAKEIMRIGSHALCVTFRPDGRELAVATLKAHLLFFDVQNAAQTRSIEARRDIGYSRKDSDKITAKKSASNKFFKTLCYSADGTCIVAAGHSKNVCIYSVADQLLLRKFEITCNHSLDGIQEVLDRRKMTEWGSLALIDEQTDEALSLPGVRSGDMSSRHWKPEVRVTGVRFSPTGREWAATTTEGLLVYSLDQSVVFDPFDLDVDVTPQSVKEALSSRSYSTAIMLSLRLNEQDLVRAAIEATPLLEVDLVISSLPDVYVDKLLPFVGSQLEASAHLEQYLRWCQRLLLLHGPKLKARSAANMAALIHLQKNLTRKFEDLRKVCDYNKYTIDYLLALGRQKRKATDDSDQGAADAENGGSAGEDETAMDEDADGDHLIMNYQA